MIYKIALTLFSQFVLPHFGKRIKEERETDRARERAQRKGDLTKKEKITTKHMLILLKKNEAFLKQNHYKFFRNCCKQNPRSIFIFNDYN